MYNRWGFQAVPCPGGATSLRPGSSFKFAARVRSGQGSGSGRYIASGPSSASRAHQGTWKPPAMCHGVTLVSRPSLHVDGEQHVPPDGRGLARDARGSQRLRQRKETHMTNTRVKLKLSKESVRVLSQLELREAADGAAPTNACRPSIRFACTTALSCGGGCDTA